MQQGDYRRVFARLKSEVVASCFDVDHGRLETRFHGVAGEASWLIDRRPAWKSIKSIGVIDATRGSGRKSGL
jgi:hypothetical protein